MNRQRHNSTSKLKTPSSINMLETKLFSQLKKIQPPSSNFTSNTNTNNNNNNNNNNNRFQDLDAKLLNSTPDVLTDLIYRAKGLTNQNQDKINKAKRSIRVSKKEAAGTFLTGTGLYVHEEEEKTPQPTPRQVQLDYDPEQMLRNLTKKSQYDDLAQLRRMIRITDQNLGTYSKQTHQIKKQVMNAASQFKSQMNFDLSYKLNKFQDKSTKAKPQQVKGIGQKQGQGQGTGMGVRKSNSLARIPSKRFD